MAPAPPILCEVAHPEHRGFYSSFQYVTLIGGQLLAMLVLLFLQKVLLTPEQIDAWGWRIPFFIGAGLAVVVYFMRRDMHESDAFLEARALGPRPSPLRALMQHPREVAIVVGLTLGGTVAFYTYTTYMQKFLVNSVGLSKDTSTSSQQPRFFSICACSRWLAPFPTSSAGDRCC